MGESELDPLEQLLAAVEESEKSEKQETKSKHETNNSDDEFFKAISSCDSTLASANNKKSKTNGQSPSTSSKKGKKKANLSLVHNGDTDSSDDESNRDFLNSKYNECGREIKHLLPEEKSKTEFYGSGSSTWKQKHVAPTRNYIPLKSTLFEPKPEENVLNDPFFGMRISKPLISSLVLKERMNGRIAVSMARVKNFVATVAPNSDWVIAGAIVQKSNVKTSQSGSQYIIWTLSDLQNDLQTVSMFLFRNAYKELWKTAIGTVVGVLNPNILENRDGSKHQATLSVDNHQKAMIFGHSKDYGLCKSKKKDGEQCTAFVNTSRCSFCIYHVKQEYQKCSLRSELQSKFAGGGLTALRNKVLGKNEVFYAGKSYMAIPAKKNKKLTIKDNQRLLALNREGIVTAPAVLPKKKRGVAASLDVSRAQRMKDMQLLQKLNGTKDICHGLDSKSNFDKDQVSNTVTVEESKKFAQEMLANFKAKNENKTFNSNLETTKFDKDKISQTVTIEESKKSAVESMAKLKAKMASFKTKDINDTQSTSNKINKTPDSELKLTEPSTSKINSSFVPKLSNPEVGNKKQISEPLTASTSKTDFVPKLSKPETENAIEFDITTNEKLLNNSKNIDLSINPSKQSNNKPEVLKISNPEQQIKILNSEQDILKSPELKRNLEVCKQSNSSPKLNNQEKENSEKTPKKDKVITSQTKNESFKSCINIPNVDIESIVDVTKLKMFKDLKSQPAPKLSNNGNFVDLSSPVNKKINRSKLTALQWVQQNGPIKKENPTGAKNSGVKRFLESAEEPETKKSKLEEQKNISQRFRKIIEMTSKHADLLEQRDLEEQEKYFNKLEVREKMEEKMLSTYKIQCKAVRCLTCKYTSFSAAGRCKEEKHPLKVFDATKRFFKCGNCGNRTVSLDICPLLSCKNCGSSKWERTTMMKEKKVHVGEALSIRGGEQKFANSVVSNANINLLMPDD